MSKKELTQEYLKSVLKYDPETGIFTWLTCRHNRVKVGAVAGCLHPDGYVYIKISGKLYRAHRLAYLYMHGYMPDEVDHWDGNKSNNRIANLLDVTHAENLWKRKTPKTNTASVRGVSWYKPSQKWVARIRQDGKRYFLGYFDKLEEATAVRNKAADDLHGIFARY